MRVRSLGTTALKITNQSTLTQVLFSRPEFSHSLDPNRPAAEFVVTVEFRAMGLSTMPEPIHEAALESVVGALRQADGVLTIGAYGSTATRTWTRHSAVDLVAVVDRDPEVESLRFFVNGVPVDLNLRSKDDSDHGIGGSTFMPATVVIWDPEGVFTNAKVTSRLGGPSEARVLRYLLRHALNKLRQIGDSQKVRLTAGVEAGDFVRGYFLARGETFPGALLSMDRLQRECPELLDLLERAVLEPSEAPNLMELAGEIALGPIGGRRRSRRASPQRTGERVSSVDFAT